MNIMKKNIRLFPLLLTVSIFCWPVQSMSKQCGDSIEVEGFTDVPSGYTYINDICFLKGKKWLSGENEKYRPDDSLTRGEFAKFILSCKHDNLINPAWGKDPSCEYNFIDMLEQSLYSCFLDGKFEDIKNKNEWYVKYMCTAKQEGIITENTALPNKNVTFIEALKMTMKALGFTSCRDSDKAWQDKYLYSVIANEILDDLSVDKEKSGNIYGEISRGYAAYLIKRIYDNRDKIKDCQEVQLNKYPIKTDVVKTRISPSLKADAIEINSNDKEYIDIIGKPFKGSVVDGNDEWVMVEKNGRIGFVNAKDNYYLDLPYSDVLRVTQGNNNDLVSHNDNKIKSEGWENTYAIDFGRKCKNSNCTGDEGGDPATIYGKSVLAPADGEVVCVYDENHNGGEECGDTDKSKNGLISGGRVLVMKDKKGNYFTFIHLKKIVFPDGESDVEYSVNRGDVIAEIGTSGANAIHLHFHLWPGKDVGTPPSEHTTIFTASTPLRVGVGCKSNVEYLWGKKLDDSELNKVSTCLDKMPRIQFYSFNKENSISK